MGHRMDGCRGRGHGVVVVGGKPLVVRGGSHGGSRGGGSRGGVVGFWLGRLL